jgi:hypothetical protein
LRLRADPAAWEALGFTVEDARTRLGSVSVRFADEPGWTLAGPRSADFDGLPTELADGGGAAPGAEKTADARARHPNGALSIDHVVVFTPALERTTEAFEAAGVRCRRVRETGSPEKPLRQAFFRFGEVIAEIVEVPAEQVPSDGSARFWGLTIVVADLDGLAAELGPLCGGVRDAVQPGRRIATLKREAGLGLPVALITPDRERATPAQGGKGLGPVVRRRP